MLTRRSFSAAVVLLYPSLTLQGWGKKWQEGTLVSADRQEDRDLEHHTETNASSDDNGSYSSSRTDTVKKSDMYIIWMYYKISAGNKMYIARHMINLPWVKTATSEVGNTVKFAVEKNKLYILDQDGKEVKTEVVRTSVISPQDSPRR